jgi:hypothetical protein
VTRQPSLDRAGFAIGEKVDDASPFEIADDAAVALHQTFTDIDHLDRAIHQAIADMNHERQSPLCTYLRIAA